MGWFRINRREAAAMIIIGATAGALVGCVFVAAQLSTDPGDILGFFGGAIGAGLAVVGALWLEAVRSTKDKEKSREMLINSMNQLALAAHQFDSSETDSRIAGALLTFRQAAQTFEAMKSIVTIDDAVAYFSISSIIYWTDDLDAKAKALLERMDRGELSGEQVKATLGPRLALLAPAIRTSLGAHPYWTDGQSRLDALLTLAREQGTDPLSPEMPAEAPVQ